MKRKLLFLLIILAGTFGSSTLMGQGIEDLVKKLLAEK